MLQITAHTCYVLHAFVRNVTYHHTCVVLTLACTVSAFFCDSCAVTIWINLTYERYFVTVLKHTQAPFLSKRV